MGVNAMALTKSQKLDLVRQTKIIAIMRAQASDKMLAAAEAIYAGGVRIIEVTMTTPGALDVIAQAAPHFGDEVLFGAGSVLDAETARAAILAGAGFVVAPTLNLDTIRMCRRYSIPVMPGCYTPTECLTAWEAGADMIKLFPADMGGPDFVKAILAPLPQLEIVPVGGVTLDNVAQFLAKGATAVGVGSSLVNQKLVEQGDFAELTRRARAFVAKTQN
jgi:2-dehydro-3-deoxyphosphogluconate aldolase / (4S)-4-hydroxy-2-oxoglutarate aldolase